MAVPSKTVTNQDLAALVETNDEWITSRTGIQRCRHCAEGESISVLTAEAAQKALENL